MKIYQRHIARLHHKNPLKNGLRIPNWINKKVFTHDKGSGTVIGIALIACVGILLVVVTTFGKILACQSIAQSAADSAALAGAGVVSGVVDHDDACAQADSLASANKSHLIKCVIDNEDVEVRVGVNTDIPLWPQVQISSRAGPSADEK